MLLICPGHRLSRAVAVKIFRSDRRHDEAEARILRRLTKTSTSDRGKNHFVKLLDRFELKGPNGRHLCLVVEALGPRIESGHLTPQAVWDVARQLVEATAYFHRNGVVHGGIYLEPEMLIGDCLHACPYRFTSR